MGKRLSLSDRANRVTAAMSAAMITAMTSVTPAFAAEGVGDTIESAVTNGAEQIWDVLTAIVAPLAAVALAINVFKLIFGNSKDADAAKSKVVMLIIAIAVVFLAPVIIKQVAEWFNSTGWVDFN